MVATIALYEMAVEVGTLGRMENETKPSKISQFVRELCKGKTEEELKEAEQNFSDYLLLIKEMCDRLEREGISIPSFDNKPDQL